MTAANYANCYALTRKYEGGDDDDPRDPGGRTSRGIIQREYDKYRDRKGLARGDVWKATEAEIAEIYRAGYWDTVDGDHLPVGIDLATWDGAVNSGPARGLQWLGQGLGSQVRTPLSLSGLARQAPDGAAVVQGMCKARLGFLQRLKTFATFGRGWSSRVASVEANGVRMALTATGAAPIVIKAKIDTQATKAKSKAAAHSSSAAGTSAGGGGGATQVDWGSLDWLMWCELVAGAVVLVMLTAWFVHWALAHQARAKAYADVSATVGAT